jgi:hypothetical protein
MSAKQSAKAASVRNRATRQYSVYDGFITLEDLLPDAGRIYRANKHHRTVLLCG